MPGRLLGAPDIHGRVLAWRWHEMLRTSQLPPSCGALFSLRKLAFLPASSQVRAVHMSGCCRRREWRGGTTPRNCSGASAPGGEGPGEGDRSDGATMLGINGRLSREGIGVDKQSGSQGQSRQAVQGAGQQRTRQSREVGHEQTRAAVIGGQELGGKIGGWRGGRAPRRGGSQCAGATPGAALAMGAPARCAAPPGAAGRLYI